MLLYTTLGVELRWQNMVRGHIAQWLVNYWLRRQKMLRFTVLFLKPMNAAAGHMKKYACNVTQTYK